MKTIDEDDDWREKWIITDATFFNPAHDGTNDGPYAMHTCPDVYSPFSKSTEHPIIANGYKCVVKRPVQWKVKTQVMHVDEMVVQPEVSCDSSCSSNTKTAAEWRQKNRQCNVASHIFMDFANEKLGQECDVSNAVLEIKLGLKHLKGGILEVPGLKNQKLKEWYEADTPIEQALFLQKWTLDFYGEFPVQLAALHRAKAKFANVEALGLEKKEKYKQAVVLAELKLNRKIYLLRKEIERDLGSSLSKAWARDQRLMMAAQSGCCSTKKAVYGNDNGRDSDSCSGSDSGSGSGSDSDGDGDGDGGDPGRTTLRSGDWEKQQESLVDGHGQAILNLFADADITFDSMTRKSDPSQTVSKSDAERVLVDKTGRVICQEVWQRIWTLVKRNRPTDNGEDEHFIDKNDFELAHDYIIAATRLEEQIPKLPSLVFLCLPILQILPSAVGWVATAYVVVGEHSHSLNCYSCGNERGYYEDSHDRIASFNSETSFLSTILTLLSLAATISTFWSMTCVDEVPLLDGITDLIDDEGMPKSPTKPRAPKVSFANSDPIYNELSLQFEQNFKVVLPLSSAYLAKFRIKHERTRVLYTFDGTTPEFFDTFEPKGPSTRMLTLGDCDDTSDKKLIAMLPQDATTSMSTGAAFPNEGSVTCNVLILVTNSTDKDLFVASKSGESKEIKPMQWEKQRPEGSKGEKGWEKLYSKDSEGNLDPKRAPTAEKVLVQESPGYLTLVTAGEPDQVIQYCWSKTEDGWEKNLETWEARKSEECVFEKNQRIFVPTMSGQSTIWFHALVTSPGKMCAMCTLEHKMVRATAAIPRVRESAFVELEMEESSIVEYIWDKEAKLRAGASFENLRWESYNKGDMIPTKELKEGIHFMHIAVKANGLLPFELIKEVCISGLPIPTLPSQADLVTVSSLWSPLDGGMTTPICIEPVSMTSEKVQEAVNKTREKEQDKSSGFGFDIANIAEIVNTTTTTTTTGKEHEESSGFGFDVSNDELGLDADGNFDLDEMLDSFQDHSEYIEGVGNNLADLNNDVVHDQDLVNTGEVGKANLFYYWEKVYTTDLDFGDGGSRFEIDENGEPFGDTSRMSEDGVVELDCSEPSRQILHVRASKPGFADSDAHETFTVRQLAQPVVDFDKKTGTIAINPATTFEDSTVINDKAAMTGGVLYSWEGAVVLDPESRPNEWTRGTNLTVPKEKCAKAGEVTLYLLSVQQGSCSKESEHTIKIERVPLPKFELYFQEGCKTMLGLMVGAGDGVGILNGTTIEYMWSSSSSEKEADWGNSDTLTLTTNAQHKIEDLRRRGQDPKQQKKKKKGQSNEVGLLAFSQSKDALEYVKENGFQYPLVLKAAFGDGAREVITVESESSDFKSLFEHCSSEAAKAFFGESEVFVEEAEEVSRKCTFFARAKFTGYAQCVFKETYDIGYAEDVHPKFNEIAEELLLKVPEDPETRFFYSLKKEKLVTLQNALWDSKDEPDVVEYTKKMFDGSETPADIADRENRTLSEYIKKHKKAFRINLEPRTFFKKGRFTLSYIVTRKGVNSKMNTLTFSIKPTPLPTCVYHPLEGKVVIQTQKGAHVTYYYTFDEGVYDKWSTNLELKAGDKGTKYSNDSITLDPVLQFQKKGIQNLYIRATQAGRAPAYKIYDDVDIKEAIPLAVDVKNFNDKIFRNSKLFDSPWSHDDEDDEAVPSNAKVARKSLVFESLPTLQELEADLNTNTFEFDADVLKSVREDDGGDGEYHLFAGVGTEALTDITESLSLTYLDRRERLTVHWRVERPFRAPTRGSRTWLQIPKIGLQGGKGKQKGIKFTFPNLGEEVYIKYSFLVSNEIYGIGEFPKRWEMNNKLGKKMEDDCNEDHCEFNPGTPSKHEYKDFIQSLAQHGCSQGWVKVAPSSDHSEDSEESVVVLPFTHNEMPSNNEMPSIAKLLSIGTTLRIWAICFIKGDESLHSLASSYVKELRHIPDFLDLSLAEAFKAFDANDEAKRLTTIAKIEEVKLDKGVSAHQREVQEAITAEEKKKEEAKKKKKKTKKKK